MVAGTVACALTIAACGSSSSGSGGSTSGGSTTTTSGSSSKFPAATTANTRFEQRPTSVGLTTPVGASIPKGKTVDFIQCGVPACVVEGDILQSATNLLGWKLVRINAGTTPQQIVDAYQQAITNKPDAVVGSGYPRALFNPEIATLKSMNIPVVEAFVADPTSAGFYVVAGQTTSAIQGQEVADFTLANGGSSSMTLGSVVPSGFPNVLLESQAFNSTVHAQCSGCTVKTLQVPVTSIGTDLPTRVSTFLTANPNVQWAWVGYDDMVTGLPVALQGASITGVNVTTISMNATVAQDIRSGKYVVTGIGTSFPEVYWREIDLLARLFTHGSVTGDLDDRTLPYWTITKANIPSNAGSTEFANVVDYQDQFKKLWGLG